MHYQKVTFESLLKINFAFKNSLKDNDTIELLIGKRNSICIIVMCILNAI